MIEVNLKRIKGNRSCTLGILQIPQFEFRCQTLELADGSDFYVKQNCRLDEGSYVLVKGFENMCAFFPVFKKKPKHFACRPKFIFEDLNYMGLSTGDIGLGVKAIDEFSIQGSAELEHKFKELFTHIFTKFNETVVLTIYKSKAYEDTDGDYFETQKAIEDMNFLQDEENLEMYEDE